MQQLLQTAKDFKIIPNNFKSSAKLEAVKSEDDKIHAIIVGIPEEELEDYQVGSEVEIFAVNEVGLIYFETKILERNGFCIVLSENPDYSLIQRREYSRVSLQQGAVIFEDKQPDFVVSVEDISAGGMRIITREPLLIEEKYDVCIELSSNMKITCALQPVRVIQKGEEQQYVVSGRFVNLENIDRIVLVQYAFKINMEDQNISESFS